MEGFATKHDQERMRQQNGKLVFTAIQQQGPVSRADLAKVVDMSPTSVGRIVEDLLAAGLVREGGVSGKRLGRRANLLEVDPSAVLAIGVELDRDRMAAALVRFDGKVLEERVDNTPMDDCSPACVAERVAHLVRDLVADSRQDLTRLAGVGVALPGLVDWEKGEVILSAQLKWHQVPFRDLLQQLLPEWPVSLDNEMKAGALADTLYHRAPGPERVVRMRLGSGVGAVLSIHNRVYRGASNFAGEIGHITIDPKGNLCACGRFGCLQTYIAEGALLQEANKFRPVRDLAELVQAFQDQEPWAVGILKRAVEYIGTAIGTLVCLYNPNEVTLGGRLVSAHPAVAALILDTYRDSVWEPLRDTFILRLADDAATSGLTAAAVLAFATALQAYIL